MIFIFAILLIPTLCFAKCEIPEAIQSLKPRAEWVLRGNSYDGLEWLDTVQPKPTEKEIETAIATCKQEEISEAQQKERAKIDLNTRGKTDTERLEAIIKYLGLDR